eukprot:CAMPEP_0115875212 /NCGR_PEP_ID=MMETSP0287-20121206/24972_1 /TAXON_ID=412157 /ORGANISM="Chrysochromulina rotalis, Strain UIO044" /LENGTH=58 /DNA_ID=CAMNT_0003330451 /DNA_START=44 /DNA_END=220 /DNA_ORIENTATION=+
MICMAVQILSRSSRAHTSRVASREAGALRADQVDDCGHDRMRANLERRVGELLAEQSV